MRHLSEDFVEQRQILVAEHDQANQEVLKLVFTHETSYLCHFVSTGREALQIIKTRTPDLFLLDFHLPDIQCLDLYHHIQNHPRFSAASVLIMSSLEDNSPITQQALPLLKKPFSIDRLLNTLQSLLAPHNPLTT